MVNKDESLFSFRHTCLHSTYKGKYKLHTTYILSMYVLHKYLYLFSYIFCTYLDKKLFLVISAVIDILFSLGTKLISKWFSRHFSQLYISADTTMYRKFIGKFINKMYFSFVVQCLNQDFYLSPWDFIAFFIYKHLMHLKAQSTYWVWGAL